MNCFFEEFRRPGGRVLFAGGFRRLRTAGYFAHGGSSSQSPLVSVSAWRRKLRPLPCSSSPTQTSCAGLCVGGRLRRPIWVENCGRCGFTSAPGSTEPTLRVRFPLYGRHTGPPAHAGPTASAPGSRCGPSNNLNLHQKNPLMRIALGHLGIHVPAHSIGILHQRVSNKGPCHAASNRAQFGAFSIVLKIFPWAPLSLDAYISLIYTNIS